MTNYANTDFPAAIYVTCSQAQGMLLADGSQTRIIAVLVPASTPVPVYNSGGIIGYNQTYGLMST